MQTEYQRWRARSHGRASASLESFGVSHFHPFFINGKPHTHLVEPLHHTLLARMVGFPQACCEYPNGGCLSVCVQFETGIQTGFMVSSVNMHLQERVLTTPIL